MRLTSLVIRLLDLIITLIKNDKIDDNKDDKIDKIPAKTRSKNITKLLKAKISARPNI